LEQSVLSQIRNNLLEKRRNLTDWLKFTPDTKKDTRLGPAGEDAVHAHLHILDNALIKVADQTLGVCKVCHGYVETDLLELDYTCCVCLDHLSEAEKRQLETELELSANIQKALLPQEIPVVPGMELAAFNRPAQILGGDYFDFFQLRNGSFGLIIADVVGHGVSASLIMASMQTVLRTLIPEMELLADLVQRVNHFFIHNVKFTTFVTLFIASYNPESGVLTYCNAGHNPVLLHRSNSSRADKSDWLEPNGAAIGLVEDFRITAVSIPLKQGDVLLLYTDGIPEAVNARGEAFGRQRLAELVEDIYQLPAKTMVQTVRRSLEEFTRGTTLADDITLIAGKII
jgi:sigma-B regulation protein RsbU (phosphoserine phosphatase)